MTKNRTPIQAHSKTEFKRLTAQGANVLPPPNVHDLQEQLSAAKQVIGSLLPRLDEGMTVDDIIAGQIASERLKNK